MKGKDKTTSRTEVTFPWRTNRSLLHLLFDNSSQSETCLLHRRDSRLDPQLDSLPLSNQVSAAPPPQTDAGVLPTAIVFCSATATVDA